MYDFRTHETEKGDKKPGKRSKVKRERKEQELQASILMQEIVEEAGEEVEGGWEKVKGGAPLVKVKEDGVRFL